MSTPPTLAVSPELAAAAAAHVALVSRLERLADLGGQDTPRPVDTRADHVRVDLGDVVLVRAQGRWRYSIIVALGVDGDPCRLRAAFLPPSALDQAQRTWITQTRTVLQPDYPRQQAIQARREHHDATAAEVAAIAAFQQAVFTQAVGTGCPRRPWAAVVPPVYVERRTVEVFRARDQQLGAPPLSPAP